jgi:hypothetical protein
MLAALLHRSTLSLKLGLLREPGVVVTDVPRLAANGSWIEPTRATCVIPVADVHAASLRALVYARSLGLADTRAVYFAFEDDDAARVQRDWRRYELDVPLEIIEAPYRDVGQPLLSYLAAITADDSSIALVVMPELVVRGVDRLLHNQRALYLKRLLLFEPQVILTSVPYQLA